MTSGVLESRRLALRPLALPSEHGGWGLLLEPVALGLLVAPSITGVIVAISALFAFLVRQPLRLALQDARRGKVYPRTRYCWMLVLGYGAAALVTMSAAVARGGAQMLIPVALIAPLAIVQLLYDASNRSRALLPEVSGTAALCSVTAVVAMAGATKLEHALGFSGIALARALPAVMYVRVLLRGGRVWPVILLHVIAVVAIGAYASPFALAAMVILLLRATYGLSRPAPPAKTVGWLEIVFGVVTVSLAVIGA
jgi:hypothetical protein